MSNINFNKLLDMFRNLKSDAVPRAPRPTEQKNGEEPRRNRNREAESNINSRQTQPNPSEDDDEEEEEIVIEPETLKKNKKEKKSKSMKSDDVDDEDVNYNGDEKRHSSSSAHIQATGTVYNIMNSKHVRLGNDFYFGPVTQSENLVSSSSKEKKYEHEHIVKDNFISLLMEATIKPDHDYLDYISKNLGKNWHSFFRSLKFTQGKIETAEINAAGYDISEARYKLLLDWVKNDEVGSLGRLATLLWEEGERSIVKELSLMYKKSKK